jgi:ribosomal protein S21
MALITVNQGESILSALRSFKRRVIHEGIIQDVKRYAYFMPPGEKAKPKSKQARKRRRKMRRPLANPRRERTETMRMSGESG